MGKFILPTDATDDTKLTTQNNTKMEDADKIFPTAFQNEVRTDFN